MYALMQSTDSITKARQNIEPFEAKEHAGKHVVKQRTAQLVDQESQENQLQVFRSWEAQETAMNRLKQNQRRTLAP